LTLRNRCVNCDQVIEQPDSMRGKEVTCPNCEAKNVLLSDEDARQRASSSGRLERERRRFMDSLDRTRETGRQPEAGWQAPIESLGRHGVGLITARRLRDISVYMLAFAYLLLMLALGLGALLGLMVGLPGVWSAFSFLASAFTGILCFLFFKFMSDGVRALADLSDLAHSIDTRLTHLASAQPSAPQYVTPGAPDPTGEVLSGQPS